MNKRSLWIFGISTLIHGFFFLFVPAPSFEKPDSPTRTEVRVNFNQTPLEPTTSQQEVKKEEEKSTKPERNPDKQTVDQPDNSESSTPKKEQQDNSRNKPIQSKRTTQQTKSQTESSQDYSLLDNGKSFESPRQKVADQESQKKESILNEQTTTEKFAVIDRKNQSGTTPDEVRIEIPDSTQPSEKPVQAPTYTLDDRQFESTAAQPEEPLERDRNRSTEGGREAINQPLPTLPDWLERTGESVKVILQFTVEPSGEVDSVAKLNSSGYIRLDNLSIKTVKNWRYESAETKTIKVTVFRFVLK